MSLSKRYTAIKFFREASRDTNLSANSLLYADRFNMINSVVDGVYTVLYPLMMKSYQRLAILIKQPAAGKYDNDGAASYASTTQAITVPNINTSLTDSDIGKIVAFRQASSNLSWFGTIETVPTTTSFTVSGNVLPGSDITLAEVLIPGTFVTQDKAILTDLRINRAVAPVNFVLESTATTSVRPVTREAFDLFNEDAHETKKQIVFILEGESLLLKKGSSLTTYGSLILSYPAMPVPVSLNAQYIDLPDGAPMELALKVLRAKIYTRLGKPIEIQNDVIATAGALFRNEAPAIQQKKAEEIAALL